MARVLMVVLKSDTTQAEALDLMERIMTERCAAGATVDDIAPGAWVREVETLRLLKDKVNQAFKDVVAGR